MEAKPRILVDYETDLGKCPIRDWLDTLDRGVRSRVEARLKRVTFGNFGDSKSVGEGVNELRLDFGSGYRVYFAEFGDVIVVLLTGGDKSSQTKDIELAKQYWNDFKEKNNAQE